MKIDFNRVDDLNARISIVLEQADYKPKLDENLKNYSKKLNLKGFRAGKTPKNVLTKMYGKGMLEETVNTMLNERLFKYLEDEKIDIFGSPVLTADAERIDFNPKALADYAFEFDLGLKPSFEVKYHFDEPLEIATVEGNPDALDEDIQRYRRIFGDEVPVEGAIEKHDRVGIKLSRIGDDGQGSNDPIETVIDLDRIKGQASTDLPGHEVGYILEADLEQFFGYDRKGLIKNTLGLEEDPSPDQPPNYKVEITSIARPQSTELSGEQISKYVGQQVEDEQGLRRMLEARERNTNLTRTNDLKKLTVRKALLDANPFEIPEEFLLKWVNTQREKQIEPGSRDAKNLFREAKWSLLLNRIITDAGLEVTDKDIQKQVTRWVMENVNYTQTD